MRDRKKLIHELADAAWHELNHDNDPTDGQEHNTQGWERLTDAINKILKRYKI